MNHRGFVQQIGCVRVRILDVDAIERTIGRGGDRMEVSILVNDLESNACCDVRWGDETYAFNVSGLVVDEMDPDDAVLADASQQAIVVEKVRRQAIVIDEVREKFLFGKIHLERMPMKCTDPTVVLTFNLLPLGI